MLNITGSIAPNASRRYLVYSEADFEVFHPTRATRCTDGVKFGIILLDLLKGLWSYGSFNLRGSGYPKFSAPSSGETMRQTPKSFKGARTCSRSSITMPSLVGLGFHPPSRQPKTLSILFVCLSVRHAFERQRLCARFRYEGVGVQKRF